MIFMRRYSRGKKFLFLIPIGLLAIALFGFIVMLLWNNVLVAVTHVSVINFWQALGILVLSKILFGGFHGGPKGRHAYWKGRMVERWEKMTPEEREKFKQEWKARCGRRFDMGEEKPSSTPAAE
jgi:hypothetical protein